MTTRRLLQMIRISFLKNGFKRAEYLKKKKVFASMGEHCFWQPRNIPPETGLIRIGDNVAIASEVLFINHDVMHHVFNGMKEDKYSFYRLTLGAIEIGNNVFIGSRCTILPGSKIEDNVIIGAGAVVSGKLSKGGVYAGVPAKRVGDFDTIMKSRRLDAPEVRAKTERFSEEWEIFYKHYEDKA